MGCETALNFIRQEMSIFGLSTGLYTHLSRNFITLMQLSCKSKSAIKQTCALIYNFACNHLIHPENIKMSDSFCHLAVHIFQPFNTLVRQCFHTVSRFFSGLRLFFLTEFGKFPEVQKLLSTQVHLKMLV